eukprot:NODE_2515_length_1561_cov_10.976356_g2166_i0.p1 GENE.NODE_2515_length_1561_cov_10.976356_g2166_i0~~NODE_2515_length_1561_cov_10.976356_g2166_i0.p1  ORF type:complete len:421 (-),score=42.95 NODE_2515_length_1561_cov_10.976356_g2166_i0:218-1480(-)
MGAGVSCKEEKLKSVTDYMQYAKGIGLGIGSGDMTPRMTEEGAKSNRWTTYKSIGESLDDIFLKIREDTYQAARLAIIETKYAISSPSGTQSRLPSIKINEIRGTVRGCIEIFNDDLYIFITVLRGHKIDAKVQDNFLVLRWMNEKSEKAELLERMKERSLCEPCEVAPQLNPGDPLVPLGAELQNIEIQSKAFALRLSASYIITDVYSCSKFGMTKVTYTVKPPEATESRLTSFRPCSNSYEEKGYIISLPKELQSLISWLKLGNLVVEKRNLSLHVSWEWDTLKSRKEDIINKLNEALSNPQEAMPVIVDDRPGPCVPTNPYVQNDNNSRFDIENTFEIARRNVIEAIVLAILYIYRFMENEIRSASTKGFTEATFEIKREGVENHNKLPKYIIKSDSQKRGVIIIEKNDLGFLKTVV